MEINYNELLAKNILFLRKEQCMTQDELASVCNVSFQAISKWENNLTSPDISLLPVIAKTFNISIDDLFNVDLSLREKNENNDNIRVLVYQGNKQILSKNPLFDKIEILLDGKIQNLYSYGDLHFKGKVDVKEKLEVQGDFTVDNASCGGVSVRGEIHANRLSTGGLSCHDIKADQISTGGLSANDITATKLSTGGLSCKNDINADSIKCEGDLRCDGDITVKGSLIAKNIKGNISHENKDVKVNIQKYNSVINDSCDEDIEDDLEDLQEELDDLQEEINDTQEELADLQTEYDDLQREYADLQGKYDELKKKR